MNTKTTFHDDHSQKHQKCTSIIKKIFWTSLGAASIARSEGETIIHKLIEKGKQAEKEGRGQIEEFKTHRKQKAEETVEEHIERILHRMDFPTKSDYQNLSEKISELSQKLEKKTSK